MNTIETMIKEYEQLKAERAAALEKMQAYIDAYNALGQQMGLDPSRLLKMKVVSCEKQRQAWSNKNIVYVAFEEAIEEVM